MTQFCHFFEGGIEVQTVKQSLKPENSLVNCTHECTEPHNSLFVRCFMVKIPRIHEQCPDTAVSRSRSDAALASQTLSQCSCFGPAFSLLGLLKNQPLKLQHGILPNYPPSIPCKLYLSKDKFSLDSITMLLEGRMGGWYGRPPILPSPGKIHFNIKYSS